MVYFERIQLTLDTNNEEIKKSLVNEIKEMEADEKSAYQVKLELDEELKKYTESYSPYPYFLLAYKLGVSDIRILPLPKSNTQGKDDRSKLYFKIDGFWEEVASFSRNKHVLYINAIKNWSIKGAGNLSPDNQRISQDGKGVLHILNDEKEVQKSIQLRIATVPQHIKDDNNIPLELCVIRLLDGAGNPTLEQAGFSKYDYKKILSLGKEKKGLVLISGPTGSGKSSTLFGYIDKLNDGTKNIITFENPVEFDVPGVSQIEINPKEDIPDDDEVTLNFSRSKDFAMRAAPDILLVWEMRNYYTAEAGVTFANTGHIALATIHTNSCLETINRLLGMKKGEDKLDKILLLSILKYVSAQMLVPSLCPHCKIRVKDITTDTQDPVWNEYYKKILEDISIQRRIIQEEILAPNVKQVFPTLNEQTLDIWIETSYVENINGCNKCMIRKPGEPIKSKIGRKGRTLINEALIFDPYVIDLLSKEPFSKDVIKHELLFKRPLYQPGESGFMDDEKRYFFSLYQDALFKALLSEKAYPKVYELTNRPRSISILDALTYWK